MDALTAARTLVADATGFTGPSAVLKDGSNLLVHFPGAEVVVRVATFTGFIRRDPMPWLEREVALMGHLAAMGAAVVPPSAHMAPGPYRVGEWCATVWQYVPHVAGAVPEAAEALALLDELHTSMASFTGDLPAYGPVAGDLDLALDRCAEHGLLDPDEIDHIRSQRAALLALVDGLPRQAQHGDAFPRNTLVTPDGPVWNDFEDCCSASPLWDLAVMARRDGTGLVRQVAEERFGADAVGWMIGLRELQSRVWTVLHDARATGRLP